MPEANEIKIENKHYDVYDYVLELEGQLRILETEKQITGARLSQVMVEMERLRKEISEMQSTPLVMGLVLEVLENGHTIVRNSNGVEFLVESSKEIASEIKPGKRVAMNQRNLLIMKVFPENKDFAVNAMEVIEKPETTFEHIGGAEKQILELEEAAVLPLTNPEGFETLGINAPNGVLLHGLPGTGKTMLAKALANKANATFISLSGPDLVRKYIGEGAKLVRDVFSLAREKKPAIIFIDEIDAVGSHRFATSNGDREVQRTLMQLLSEMDGFRELKGVKVIAATNRIDMLDPALLRPGRFDRIIEVPLPDAKGREKIFRIHSEKMRLGNNIELTALAEISNGFSGADIKAVCTEAGMLALREGKNLIGPIDFERAIEKVSNKSGEEKQEHRMFA